MARRENESILDYKGRVEEMEKMRNLELREVRAQGGRYRPGMSFYDMNRQDIAEQREKYNRETGGWERRKWEMSLSPKDRQEAIRQRLEGVTEGQRFQADNAFRNAELRTRETEAGYKAQGMEYQGARAAEFNAEAVKRKAELDAATATSNINAQKEIEAGKRKTELEVAGINADAKVDAQTEANKGLGIQGNWNVRLEQERAKTEAAKAAAQEQVWKSRQESKAGAADNREMNRRIDSMVKTMQQQPRYRGKSIEELVELAKQRIAKQNGNGE